jgi:galactose mutarotase-like enzyme
VYNQDFYDVPGGLTKLEPVSSPTIKNLAKRTTEGTTSKTLSMAEKTASDISPFIAGKGGAHYQKHAAFCLETQKYPDSINHVSCCQ